MSMDWTKWITIKLQFDTNQTNKVTKHITTLQKSKEFMGL